MVLRQGCGDGVPTGYADFAPALTERAAIAPLVAEDAGVWARKAAVGEALAAWWREHAGYLAELQGRQRDLNAVRREVLAGFTEALLPLGVLDRFKLAGVVATWWTDTLPDFKTLIENGFAGVIDGWVDAIADAVDDDDNVGPAFDPFNHKLVRRTMADYLQRIDDARADIARLKGEKEAFEQSNPPDDADDEDLAGWNYAKELEGQVRELKRDNRDALRRLDSLAYAASKRRATDADREAAERAKAALQPVLDRLAALGTALAPYEQIRADLAAARGRYRELMSQFVAELRGRCDAMAVDEKEALVLELFAQDIQTGLDAALAAREQTLVRFIEELWDKYRVPLSALQADRDTTAGQLGEMMGRLGYVG